MNLKYPQKDIDSFSHQISCKLFLKIRIYKSFAKFLEKFQRTKLFLHLSSSLLFLIHSFSLPLPSHLPFFFPSTRRSFHKKTKQISVYKFLVLLISFQRFINQLIRYHLKFIFSPNMIVNYFCESSFIIFNFLEQFKHLRRLYLVNSIHLIYY